MDCLGHSRGKPQHHYMVQMMSLDQATQTLFSGGCIKKCSLLLSLRGIERAGGHFCEAYRLGDARPGGMVAMLGDWSSQRGSYFYGPLWGGSQQPFLCDP